MIEISDGGATPHATDYADLLAKLVTFASANGWTVVENTSDKVVLQGVGSGSDEIFVAIQKYGNVGTDSYGWRVNGYTGYQVGATFYDQSGAIQMNEVGGVGMTAMPGWNSTTPYWFIVSGRRIIVVTKVSTTYQACYLGFYLPFASPNQYPYPLTIGGSYIGSSGQSEPRWSGTGSQSSQFWTGLNLAGSSLFVRMPGGGWYSPVNGTSTGMFPYNQADVGRMRQGLDDEAILSPIELQQSTGSPATHNRLGELDGVYHVSGFGVSAEDVVTIDANDYVIIPNVYRSGATDYVAFKLV